MIRATVFAYAGVEEKPFVEEQVDAALGGFEAVLDVVSVEELVEEYKGKLVFKPNVQWPSIYHFRLLAFTHTWRTAENRRMVAEVVKRLVELSPFPSISVRSKSQLIAPASFCVHDFDPDMGSMDDAQWMMWFHRMECLARLGVVNMIPELRRQVGILVDILEADNGRFTKKLTHFYFSKWGGDPGLMLETNWRSRTSSV